MNKPEKFSVHRTEAEASAVLRGLMIRRMESLASQMDSLAKAMARLDKPQAPQETKR